MFLILTLGMLSVVLALVLTPLIRDSIGKLAFLDHPDGERKIHVTAIPRVGGIAIVLAYVATFAIALALPFTYTYVLHQALPQILELTVVGLVVFLTGVLDDLVGLGAKQKLLGIVAAAAFAYAAHIRVGVGLFNLPAWPWLSFVITVVWLVGCTNAFNLIDGMDGLAAGVGLVSTLTVLIMALIQGNLPLALATMPLAGCLLGFLRYNFNPASVFLGDSGSLLIGFLLGCYGALWSEKSVTLLALTGPLLAVSVPLLDVLLSIARRYLRNRPIFQADRGHIHHKLLDRGLSHRSAVLTIYAGCGVFAVLSLLVSAIHNRFSGLIVIAFLAAAWFGIRHLEYTEFAMAGKMFIGGKFRRIIDAETRLIDFENNLAKASDVDTCWSLICAGSRQFGFQGVRMHVNGKVFEEQSSVANGRIWQVRIPLPRSEYVNFFRDFTAEMDPLILSAFVTAVERGLTAWLSAPKVEVVRMPATPHAYAAAAGTERRVS